MRYIGKVMFLAAVARPRKETAKNSCFGGKLQIWPFVERNIAQRTSTNLPAGTIETMPVTAVTRTEYVTMLLNNVIPAIATKFPRRSHRKVFYLQQDNSKPNIKEDDMLVGEAGRQLRLNLRLLCQAPNSPDFNVLDLGYF
uniref:Mar1 transposase putative n=1 Tax=Albugo laibachii Nc14 TaxID=890382 RepID=F0X0T3_9STRA|nr:mar1 transposase putative [Albugo laibachii Nc14]|eukprot:CCA27377.1 mar1 transposase putative [Albugo laibachii Nc14]